MPATNTKGCVLLAGKLCVWVIAAVAVSSHGKASVVSVLFTNTIFAKSISAAAETILKWVAPPGADTICAGIKEGILRVTVPATLSITGVKGAKRVVPNFAFRLKSNPA